MKSTGKSFGFTLIEIVVVIAIMAVLTVILYASFGASRTQSNDQKRVADISSIQLGLEQFFQKNGRYPEQLAELVPMYIPEIPKDSLNDYSKNYFPMTKSPLAVPRACISYQLWAKFDGNNSYLNSRKGFNSTVLPLPNGLFECGTNHNNAKIDAFPVASKIYDVMP